MTVGIGYGRSHSNPTAEGSAMTAATASDPNESRTAARPGQRARHAFWYVGMLVGCAALFVIIQELGTRLPAPPPPADFAAPGADQSSQFNLMLHVLAALAAIIAVGHLFGRAFVLIGQPPVIGEVLAGIALGPSLLGYFAPEATDFLYPGPDSDPRRQVSAALRAVSQVGVVLYMFLVGLELNASKLRHQAKAAVAISHASIVAPFILGAALALWLYPNLSHSGVPFTSFALFMGAAMAVTAFPVLARILADRRLDKSDIGVLALGCAAADDITAWCLLALVVGAAKTQVNEAAFTVLGAVGFIAVMFLVVRPLAERVARRLDAAPGPLPAGAIPGVLAAVLLSALVTEAIGIHAAIGAFLLGAVIPHDTRLAAEFTKKLHDVVTVLLLPAFFAVTGMRTRLGLMDSFTDWMFCAAIIAVATVGKFGGTFAAARLSGYDWKTASALGALMNTRGLMGLIVLNMGLSMGVISPKLFAMMVLMAIATTMATAPLLDRLVKPKEAAHS